MFSFLNIVFDVELIDHLNSELFCSHPLLAGLNEVANDDEVVFPCDRSAKLPVMFGQVLYHVVTRYAKLPSDGINDIGDGR